MTTGPRTITILRHAEKPSAVGNLQPAFGVDEQGRPQAESLIPRGWQRAGALAAVLGSAAPPSPFVRPTALFAPAYPDGTLHRPGETVTPLARRLKLQIQTPVPKGQEDVLVSASLLLNRVRTSWCAGSTITSPRSQRRWRWRWASAR